MAYDDWNYGHLTGSGHAQSMLLHGQPALSRRALAKPWFVAGQWRDESFPGGVDLWQHEEPQVYLELRWRHRSNSGRIDLQAAKRIVAKVFTQAEGLEWCRLDERYGETEVDRVQEADDPALHHLKDLGALLELHRDEMIRPGVFMDALDLGYFATEERGGLLIVVWRQAGQLKERRIALDALIWANGHMDKLIQRLLDERDT